MKSGIVIGFLIIAISYSYIVTKGDPPKNEKSIIALYDSGKRNGAIMGWIVGRYGGTREEMRDLLEQHIEGDDDAIINWMNGKIINGHKPYKTGWDVFKEEQSSLAERAGQFDWRIND